MDKKNIIQQQLRSSSTPLNMLETIAADKTGSIILTLWGQQIDTIMLGSSYKMLSISVKEHQGVKSLTTSPRSEIISIDDIGTIVDSNISTNANTEIIGKVILVQVKNQIKCTNCSNPLDAKMDAKTVRCSNCNMKQLTKSLHNTLTTTVKLQEQPTSMYSIFHPVMEKYLLNVNQEELLTEADELEDFLLDQTFTFTCNIKNIVVDMKN